MIFSSAKTRLAGVLGAGETERRGEPGFDAKQVNRHRLRCVRARIVSQPRCPCETSMGTLGTRKQCGRNGERGIPRLHLNLHALSTQQISVRMAMNPSAPIPPEERCETNRERMEQHTDLARLFGRAAIPLTLLTERAGAATVDAGSVHHTQAAIGFSAVFMRGQLLICRAAKRSIGLERKVLAREAIGLPGGTSFGRSIARERRGVW